MLEPFKSNKMIRQSNIELLRLVCMLMVVNLHSFSGYDHGEGILQALDFFRETACISAVDTFVLISGYFGIRWKFKSLFNLLFQVAFYSLVVYGFCVLIGVTEFNNQELLSQLKCFYKSYGFITSYIVLWFLSPALNAIAEHTPASKLSFYILSLLLANIFVMGLNIIVTFCVVYLIGRWISKTDAINKLNVKSGCFYLVVTLIIFVIVYTLYRLFGFGAVQMQSFFFGYNYSAPLVILQGVALLLFFGRMKIQSSFINWCSASCLSIFLIHMHPSVKGLYYSYTENLYELSWGGHYLYLILLFAVVFVGSILIDKIRIAISDMVFVILLKIKAILPNKLMSFERLFPQQVRDLQKTDIVDTIQP